MQLTPRIAAAIVISLSSTQFAAAQSGELVIYNPAGEVGEGFANRFQELYPNISVSMISGGVGEMFTRIAAEADNPRGDVLICASSEAYLANPQFFASYESAEIDNFPSDVVGPDMAWYGCSMPLQAFVVNTGLLDEADWPRSWSDLGEARYEDKIVLANPSLSGSAYAQTAQMLQLYGWDLIEDVIDNARFVNSSSTVYQDVARGEMEIGVTGEANIGPLIAEGFPVAAIYPEDGTGLRYDATSIIDGGPNPENARLFLDFANSREAHEIVASTNRRSVRPDVDAPAGLAPTAEITTFPYDVERAATQRAEITARWEEIFAQ